MFLEFIKLIIGIKISPFGTNIFAINEEFIVKHLNFVINEEFIAKHLNYTSSVFPKNKPLLFNESIIPYELRSAYCCLLKHVQLVTSTGLTTFQISISVVSEEFITIQLNYMNSVFPKNKPLLFNEGIIPYELRIIASHLKSINLITMLDMADLL